MASGKHDAKGRTKGAHRQQMPDKRGGSFALMPHAVLDSPAYIDLSPLAKCALLAIHRHFNGYNNGAIHLSTRGLHQALGTSDNPSLARAIRELETHGFVEITSGLEFNVRRKAREFRLTYIDTGEPSRLVPATNDYLRWQGEPRKQRRGRAKNSASETHAEKGETAWVSHAGGENAAWETHASEATRPRSQSEPAALETHALIYLNHSGAAESGRRLAGSTQSKGAETPRAIVPDVERTAAPTPRRSNA